MKSLLTFARIRGVMKCVLSGGMISICATCLLGADLPRVSPGDAIKAVTTKTNPEYGMIAKQLKLSGPVGLDVVIAEDGTVDTITVVRGNPVLAKQAVEAVKKWKFIPFKSDGKAIRVISEIVIQFNL